MTRSGHRSEWYSETRAYVGLALFKLIALSRIVGRVHIGDALWTRAVHLNNRFFSKPSEVLHALLAYAKTHRLSVPFHFFHRGCFPSRC
jgi:hypothetical protein